MLSKQSKKGNVLKYLTHVTEKKMVYGIRAKIVYHLRRLYLIK